MTSCSGVDSIALSVQYPQAPWPHHALLAELVWILDGVQSVEIHVDGDVGGEIPHGLTVFVTPEDAPQAQTHLAELLAEHQLVVQLGEPRPIVRADWETAWQQYWKITPIAPLGSPTGLVISPSWEQYTPQAGETLLTLDPGGAFGTGTHPTTQLMLASLAQGAKTSDFNQVRLLDVGCGSGVLSIAAAKLGCRDVISIDIEPEAVSATVQNAQLNGVSHAITASTTPLAELCLTPFDGVLMNIHWPVLEALIPEVAARLAPHGWLWVSGLIEKTVPLCQHALESQGFMITENHQSQDWWLLQATRG